MFRLNCILFQFFFICFLYYLVKKMYIHVMCRCYAMFLEKTAPLTFVLILYLRSVMIR